MTVLIEGTNSIYLGAKALIVPEDREIASDWASKHVKHNPAYRWILGKFVEADNANQNNQFWAYDQLRLGQPTIEHAPMNILHRPRNIVGAFVATEMIFPNESAASEGVHPYIENLGVFWKYYFADEYKVIERAHDEGSLFYSMECVAKAIEFELDGEVSEPMPYMGPAHVSYGKFNVRESVKKMIEPHFLAGALVIPPERPGWRGAEIKHLTAWVKDHAVEAEKMYASLAAETPEGDDKLWETQMLALINKFAESGDK